MAAVIAGLVGIRAAIFADAGSAVRDPRSWSGDPKRGKPPLGGPAGGRPAAPVGAGQLAGAAGLAGPVRQIGD